MLYILLLVWIGWGTASIFFSPYSDRHAGLKEILSLLYAFMVLFCLQQYADERSFGAVVLAIRSSVILLCFVSLIEILTGIHLSVSRLSGVPDVGMVSFVKTNTRLATGIFYNENDLCSFLAIFTPTIFYNRQQQKKSLRWIPWIVFAFVLFVLLKDDANIAIGCVVLGAVYYWGKNNKVTTTVFILPLFLTPVVLIGGYVIIRHVMDVLKTQVGNMQLGFGSLKMRVDIYRTAVQAVVNTFGLGVGAGGFSRYVQMTNPQSLLVNPHNWWLEILSQYGVLVFILYCTCFGKMLFDITHKNKEMFSAGRTLVTACFISFFFACIISSSFLGYGYQWLLFSMGMLSLRKDTISV